MKKKTSTFKTNYARSIFIVSLFLLAIGIVAIADVSPPLALKQFNDKYYFLKQQSMWAVIGMVALFVSANINYMLYKKFSVLFFMASIALLIIVLLPSIGYKALGARRWLNLGPVSIQPSEIIKLSLAIYIANLADSKKKIFAFILPILVSCGLIMLQPDLGTSLIVAGIGLIQMYIAGVSIFYYLVFLILGAGTSLSFVLTSAYRKQRLMTFLNPFTDSDSSYHIRQILMAIGSGGLWGVGLGKSRQKFLFVPESASDSIFAIIAEETGFIGSLGLIVLFLIFLFLGIKVINKTEDIFAKVLAVGIVSWIGLQTFVNLASMTSLIPLTGVPLPFVSYGGSSLVSILYSVGILVNIARKS